MSGPLKAAIIIGLAVVVRTSRMRCEGLGTKTEPSGRRCGVFEPGTTVGASWSWSSPP